MERVELNSEYIVEVESVARVYKMGEVEVHALKGVDLRVKRGEAIGIMGPSGSGKTTLLNLIGALDSPTQGTVKVDGEDITRLSERALTRYRRDKISFIFQFFNIIPVLSAYENVELPLLIAGVDEYSRREKTDRLLEMVALVKACNWLLKAWQDETISVTSLSLIGSAMSM